MKKIKSVKKIGSTNKRGLAKKPVLKKPIIKKETLKKIQKKRLLLKQLIIKSNILSLVLSKNKISKLKLKPGDIVRFIYSGLKFHDRNPLVLILNKNWYGKTHGIALRYLSVRQILMLASIVMKKKSIYTHFKAIFKLGKLLNITIDNPRTFYYQKIKPFIRATGTNIYRTYFYSKITNVLNYGFKFQKDIWKEIAILHLKVYSGYNRLSDADFYKQVKQTGTAKLTVPARDISKKYYPFNVKDAMTQLKKAGLA